MIHLAQLLVLSQPELLRSRVCGVVAAEDETRRCLARSERRSR